MFKTRNELRYYKRRFVVAQFIARRRYNTSVVI